MMHYMLIISAALNLFLGLFVLYSAKNRAIGLSFSFTAFCLALWSFGIFALYNTQTPEYYLFWSRFVFWGPFMLPVAVFSLSMVFPERKTPTPLFLKIISGLSILIGLLAFTPLSIESVVTYGEFKNGFFAQNIFPIYFFVFIIWSFVNLYLSHKRASEKIVKRQIRYLILGVFLMLGIGSITNLILPVALQYTDLNTIGPSATVIFTVFTTYAILKHHLFNIKIVAIEMLTGLMWLVLLAQLVASGSVSDLIIRSVLFLIFTFLSYLLIRAILREEQHTRQRYEMIATVSHQLRTPLTPIVGLAAMIADGDFDDSDEQKREAELKIYLASKRLNNIINDFLEVFELDSGMQMEAEKVDFIHLIREAMDGVKDDYQKRGLRLSLRNPNKIKPQFRSEPRVFIHAISNILDNAAKYTKKGGTTITLDADDKHIILHIKDTGIGLDDEANRRMFEKFFRSKDARNIRPDGSGLGLAIVKKIIEIHGGKIFAESSGQNKGTTFTMVLPKA